MAFKHGKDYTEYTWDLAVALLTKEGFVEMEGRTQMYEHRELHHFLNAATTQRASISKAYKTGICTVSYSMLAKHRLPRRTADEIRRANYVQYD